MIPGIVAGVNRAEHAWWSGQTKPSAPHAIWGADLYEGSALIDKVGSNDLNIVGSSLNVLPGVASGVRGGSFFNQLPSAIPLAGAKTIFYCGVVGQEGPPNSGSLLAFNYGYGQTLDFMMLIDPGWYPPYTSYITSRALGNTPITTITAQPFQLNKLLFIAVTIDGTHARHYANGHFAGDSFPRANSIMESIKGVSCFNVNNNDYNLNSADLLCCAGVYNSTATLEQLQALEASARAVFAL